MVGGGGGDGNGDERVVLPRIGVSPRYRKFVRNCFVFRHPVLAALHVSLLMFGFNYRFWLIYTLGIPGQVIILLWSNVKKKKQD